MIGEIIQTGSLPSNPPEIEDSCDRLTASHRRSSTFCSTRDEATPGLRRESGVSATFSNWFFFSFSGWGETESTWYVGHCWPIVTAPDDRWWRLWSSWWNEDWQGIPKYSEKTYPSATLSTTNPIWPDLGSNPGRRGGKPATNRLSYGTASSNWCY
jgi:hypothetical protein